MFNFFHKIVIFKTKFNKIEQNCNFCNIFAFNNLKIKIFKFVILQNPNHQKYFLKNDFGFCLCVDFIILSILSLIFFVSSKKASDIFSFVIALISEKPQFGVFFARDYPYYKLTSR